MLKKKLDQVQAWDWHVRIFHWLLLGLVINAWLTAEFGDMEMKWHQLNGLAILFLVSFRVFWGLLGSNTAQFKRFIYGPRKMLAYFKDLRGNHTQKYLSHNPLGGAMVILLLVMLAMQVSTGLFASDGMFANGPLADRVSESLSELFNQFHEIGFVLLLLLVTLHVSAVLLYLFKYKDNLIKPMLNGYKKKEDYLDVKALQAVPVWRSLVCLLLSAILVLWIYAGADLNALMNLFK